MKMNDEQIVNIFRFRLIAVWSEKRKLLIHSWHFELAMLMIMDTMALGAIDIITFDSMLIV